MKAPASSTAGKAINAAFSFKGRFLATVKPIMNILIAAVEAIGDVVGGLGAMIEPIVKGIGESIYMFFIAPIEEVLDVIGELTKAIGQVLGDALRGIGALFQWLKNLIDPFREALAGLGKFVRNVLLEPFKKLAEIIRAMATGIREATALLGIQPKQKKEDRTSAAPKVGGASDPRSIYEEITRRTAAIGMGSGKQIEEQQLDELKGIKKGVDELNNKPVEGGPKIIRK